jgi:hypothetical protein
VLGVLGDVFFNGRPLGVNVALWTLLFVAVLAVLLRVGRVPLHQGRRLMVAPMLLFAGLLSWHESPMLNAVNLFAIGGAVALGTLRRTGRSVAHAQVDDYVGGAVTAGTAALVGGVELMQREVPWNELKRGARNDRAIAVVRGAALAAPFLVLFAMLFAAADAVFQNLLSSAAPSLPDTLWQHVMLASVLAWGSAGLLRDLLAINVLDPDSLIVRTNLSRPTPDVYYLGTLSDDAVPALLARVSTLEPPLRQELARALLVRSTAPDSWLSWNASRSRATSLLVAHRDELRKLAR